MNRVPFLLKPAVKDYLWGGSRLKEDFGKATDLYPLAETWECSTHRDGQSTVDGVLLGDVLSKNPDFLGTHPLEITHGKPVLPILIKLIDAKSDLSVQVHPDDEYALANEGDFGKTEMWYVLDATDDARLVYGFNQDMTADRVRKEIEKGSISRFLNTIAVHKNDVFYIPSGTVHAIGAGCIIAEIQESSNITYRLYDYNRVDKNGQKRALHIDKALSVADLKASPIPRQPMRVLRYRNGCASELLARCRYFQVERLLINTEQSQNPMSYQTSNNSFHALLCAEGNGTVSCEGCSLDFSRGDCLFIPAYSAPLRLQACAQILDVCC